MVQKHILLLFVVLILIPMTSAAIDLKGFPRDVPVELKVPCRTATGGLCTTDFACNLSYQYPNSSFGSNNVVMTRTPNSAAYYNYTLLNLPVGDYNNAEVYCSNGNSNGTQSYMWTVGGNGSQTSTAQGIVYFVTILICSIFLFIALWGAISLPYSNNRDSDGNILEVSKTKYVKIFCIGIAYTMLVILSFFGESIAYQVFPFELATNVFKWVFNVLLAGFIPFAVVLFCFMVYNMLKDAKFEKIMKMGGIAHDK